MPLRFHWRLAEGGPGEQAAFCRTAEESGVDSVLVGFGPDGPDPLVLALALARATCRLRFMVAHRPGLMSPALFVQQVNTFSVLAGGDRILLHVEAGDEPGRADELLTVCRRFWAGEGPVSFDGRYYRVEDGRLNTPFVSDGPAPEIYLSGDSRPAREVAARHASCWLRSADAPEAVEGDLEVGLCLPALALAGTPGEAAGALLAYARAGVSQFVFSGGSGQEDREEMIRFGAEVLPLVRQAEASPA